MARSGNGWFSCPRSRAGEIACAYASGCLTREQTLAVAYHRGRLPVKHKLTGGLMAATGLSAEQAEARLAGSSCVVACDNSPCSTTLSGQHDCMLHPHLKVPG